ncbi:tetratricopeptide repeat protein, partial [Kitasatospora purpeofusca]|uniref:tetratricopeptide repeat protein n=1 Tax=Kitasatospora purpeofusca TaxID=67352 RepID=UPI00368FA581
MSTPAGPGEGAVHTQNITATGSGRVYAVQNGDQYNYIYRGTPPYRVEPFPLDAPAALPPGLARVPSRLLTARHQVVPFLPRPESALLESWRDEAVPGLSVRLLHAEGGSGKTRLAAEFAVRSAGAGWAVALARHRSEVASAGGGDQSLAVHTPGLVMVVDYAERWPLEDLITLLRQHRDAARDRLRILLLARQAGSWWQGLAHQLAKLDVLDTGVLRLEGLPDAPGARSAMYTAARDRFAEVFAHPDPAGLGVPGDLGDSAFALPLTVHMRALVDVDAASRGCTPPTGSGQASLSSYLLDREQDHWRSFHDEGHGPLRSNPHAMGRAVYVATLAGSLPPAAAAAALVRAGAADSTAVGAELAEDHSRCYPPADQALLLDPLAPDRLGEDYLALTLPGHEEEFGYHATDPWSGTAPAALLVPDRWGGEPAGYTRQALTVLIEAAHRWPHLTYRHLDPILSSQPHLALAAGSAALTRLAALENLDLDVLEALEYEFPEGRHTDLDVGIAAVATRLAHHRLATTRSPAARARIHNGLAVRQSQAGLYDDALASGREAVRIWRELTPTRPEHDSDLALALTNLGSRLQAVGHRDEALAAAEEGTAIWRRLAADAPDTHATKLAWALSALGSRLQAVGHWEEALAVAEEGVTIQQQLAADDPETHDSGLADSLHNLANRLVTAGRLDDALAARERTLAVHRRLVTTNPAAHEPELALVLTGLGADLSKLGRRKEALGVTEEAVGIYRRLAESNPAAHEPDLARTLSNVCVLLATAGRLEDAPVPAGEAVDLYRRLAEDSPAAHEPNLARALSNFGARLSVMGRTEEALVPAREAVDLYRQLTTAHPAVYEPELAAALNTLGVNLSRAGQHEEAVALTTEAVEIRRRLAADNALAHEADLSSSLANLGAWLSEAGRGPEAVPVAREAVEIRRRLAEGNRAAHEADLAHALSNLGGLLSDTGQRQQSLAPTLEALEIRRRLTAHDPAAHEADLAHSLSNRGADLFATWQWDEALPVVEEALEIRRRLAAGNPAAHAPDLASSLANLGTLLPFLRRPDDAVAASLEAVGIRRQLTEDNPSAHLPDLAKSLSDLGSLLADTERWEEAVTATEEAGTAYRRVGPDNPAPPPPPPAPYQSHT